MKINKLYTFYTAQIPKLHGLLTWSYTLRQSTPKDSPGTLSAVSVGCRGSSENFVVPWVSSQAFTTFFFNGIKDWNSLPSDIKRDGNFNRFKTSVKSYGIWILKYNLLKMIYFATIRLFYIWKYVTLVVVNAQSPFPQYLEFNP